MSKACNWGRSCNCSDCRPTLKEKCEICYERNGCLVGSTLRKDRKGIQYDDFKTCRQQCYHENYGERKEQTFNMMLHMLEDSIKKTPKTTEHVYITKRKEIKEVLCRLFREELCESDSDRSRMPQILDKLKVKIFWGNTIGEKFEYESDEIEYNHTAHWFECNILPEIIKKMEESIHVTAMQISATCKLPKVTYETEAQARRREWCRRHL
ncbi:hypothetical protein PPYR_15123 [Photinus pyralis]|uniref:Uncharacterized protein n=1 Tax=Photinus pyralis TaxID=7054 RepID=A0A1Y1ME65_PHOPY|nr:hypothetical protein PPYR_15123 [Photinus pyralis]